jgi:short-subunit dehydrogenase
MKDLRGTNAIVTGASRGLGVLIAHALADEGVNLALAARSAEALEQVRSDIAAKGVRAVSVPTDVTDAVQLDELVMATERELGPVDVLVNNAGIIGNHPYEDYPPEEIAHLIAVNLTAPLLLIRRALPGMVIRGRGHIVVVASLSGKAGYPCAAPYAASKAGLVMFVHTLRAELADTGVGCSVVCPGFVAGEGMYADAVRETGERVSRLLGESRPDKVAQAVVKAIKRDSAELIVNPTPMRPVLAFSQLFPDVSSRVFKVFGVTQQARRAVAAARNARPPAAGRP